MHVDRVVADPLGARPHSWPRRRGGAAPVTPCARWTRQRCRSAATRRFVDRGVASYPPEVSPTLCRCCCCWTAPLSQSGDHSGAIRFCEGSLRATVRTAPTVRPKTFASRKQSLRDLSRPAYLVEPGVPGLLALRYRSGYSQPRSPIRGLRIHNETYGNVRYRK